jgi:DNA-binding NarL/FixJ family response regulator
MTFVALLVADDREEEAIALEATHRILAADPDTKVLILTPVPDAEGSADAKRAGAVTYLLKQRNSNLLDAILAAVHATW